ncbi:MAG: HAMP domain-containing protein, partial [Thiotrichaceae bacterium]|nr:HAMP domain-containing protein [Thiotrichaceae bacterium]
MMKNIFTGPMAIFVVLLALFFSLRIISSAVMDVTQFQQIYYTLLAVNLVILCLLIFFISRQAWRLLKNLRAHVAGSKLTLRMVIIFVSLAIFPALIVYVFSIHFIHRSIDSWFDVTVESALEDAMTLSRSAVDEKKKTLLRQMRRLSDEVLLGEDTITIVALGEIREKSGVYEVTLMSSNGRVLGSRSIEKDGIVPDIPSSDLLLPLQQGRDHVVLDLNDDANRMIRVLTRVSINSGEDFLVLQAMAPISERLHRLAASVQQAYSEYKGLVYLRKPLKTTFTLTLSLVLLLGILSAVWAAFSSAKRIAAPIRDLSEGTKAVAEGEYHKPIPILNNDDFGLLIGSFNQMVRRLSNTHNALEESHQQEKRQKDYLEVVLGSLSSGIISLSKDHSIRTCNPEMSHILGVNMNDYQGLSLLELSHEKVELEPLVSWIIGTIDNRVKHWN